MSCHEGSYSRAVHAKPIKKLNKPAKNTKCNLKQKCNELDCVEIKPTTCH